MFDVTREDLIYIENIFNNNGWVLDFNDYTFEEFLELAMFPVGIVELLSKNNEEKIAFIDFVPDGDVDLFWIDVYDKEHQQKLLNTIREIL